MIFFNKKNGKNWIAETKKQITDYLDKTTKTRHLAKLEINYRVKAFCNTMKVM